MSPLNKTLLPVANIVVWHSHSGISERPRTRILISERSVSWQSSSPLKSRMQLSIEIMAAPLRSTAPRRFSVSSIFLEAVMTGHTRPVAIAAITSTR